MDAETSSPAPPSAEDETPLGYTAALLDEARDELGRADTKAAILLSTLGLTIGIVARGGFDVLPNRMTHGVTIALWWGGMGLGLASCAALVAAIWPRRGGTSSSAIEHVGHVTSFQASFLRRRDERMADFRDALAAGWEQPLESRINQLWVLARLLDQKFAAIRAGLGLALGAFLAIVSALLLQNALG